MTKTKTLVLAAACTMTGAGGALATDAISTSAHPNHHANHHARKHHPRAAVRADLGRFAHRAVHVDAVVATKNGFKTVTLDRGAVKSVSGQDLTITEGTPKQAYKDVTLTIPSNATVRIGRKKATLADLKAGQRVVVAQLPNRTLVAAGPGKSSR